MQRKTLIPISAEASVASQREPHEAGMKMLVIEDNRTTGPYIRDAMPERGRWWTSSPAAPKD